MESRLQRRQVGEAGPWLAGGTREESGTAFRIAF
jgi:hypothetical protein